MDNARFGSPVRAPLRQEKVVRNVLGRLTLTVPFHLWESRPCVERWQDRRSPRGYKVNSANFVLTGFSEAVAPASELCCLVCKCSGGERVREGEQKACEV
jgi:hypothetical protein